MLKQTPATDEPTPQYAYTYGKTTVNIHLLGYREGCASKVTLPIKTAFEDRRSIDIEIDHATGKGSARDSHIPADFQHDPILSEHYERLFACVDLDNPWLLLNNRSGELMIAARYIDSDSPNEIFNWWGTTHKAVVKAAADALPDAELQAMRQWSNPFYADICEDIRNRARKAIEESDEVCWIFDEVRCLRDRA